MLRRRILSGFFKFGIKGPSDTKYDVNDISISYDYGKTKVIEYTELGTVIGTDVNYVTITEDGEPKTYYKLNGKGPGKVNIAILNFTTYVNNQTITLKTKEICDSENDFLAVCHLDATDKDHIKAKITKNESKTITFDVVNKGSHFIKIYYYQHNDNNTEGEGYPNDPPHGNEHYGCFRLESWKYTYNEAYGIDAYDKPESQSIYIRSYYGWDVVNKSNLPVWVQLNMTEAKQGNKKINITLAANHGVQRTYNLVIRERKVNTEITIAISQSANPHPNDILLNINNANTTSDANSVTNIDVKLLGLNSYSVTNPNTTEFDYIKTDPTEIEDSKYSDMSIKESTLTITKKNTNNVNPVTFTINGLNVNGTKVMQKNIVINSDKVSCYCDCNQYNRCQCDVEEFKYKQEFSDCTSYSYNCNSHCSANENYKECSGHSTCISVNTCNGHVASRYCTSNTLDTCGSQCGSNGCNINSYNSCGSQCGSNGCNSNTLDTCGSQSKYCTSNTNDTCSGKCGSNGCNSNVYSCVAEWYGEFYIDLILTYQALRDIKFEAVYVEIEFYPVQQNHSDKHNVAYMNIYYEYSVNETSSPKRLYLPHCCMGSKIVDVRVWATPSNNSQVLYRMDSIYYNQKDASGLQEVWNGTIVSIELRYMNYWTGNTMNELTGCMSVGCECHGYNAMCYCHGDSICHGKTTYCSPDTYDSCGSQCGSNGCNSNTLDTCGSQSKYCTSNINDTCSGHYKYCTSNTNDTCGSQCSANGCNYTTCPSQRFDCTCNTKLYYPYCNCETKCECYNYTFPEVCESHNCKTDENTCNCNSQVTCSAKSLY